MKRSTETGSTILVFIDHPEIPMTIPAMAGIKLVTYLNSLYSLFHMTIPAMAGIKLEFNGYFDVNCINDYTCNGRNKT